MPGRLQDRIALVTGSSSGLGRAIALAFASEGAKICCVDAYTAPRNAINPHTGKADSISNRADSDTPSTLSTLQTLYGNDRAIFVQADVTKASDVQAAVAECVRTFGRLDILANNAGVSVESTRARPLGEEDWDLTMGVNAKGVFLGCKYGVAQMLGQERRFGGGEGGVKGARGWIVNTASVQGLVAYHHTPCYTASKGAVVQLTKQVALDYAADGIRCNAICPGFLRTAMTQNLQSDENAQREIDKAHPLGGMGDVEDVARAALFLASDDVAWITGVNLPVDGGYTIM